jgi:hypothetical protein
MGPLAWSAISLLVCVISLAVVLASMRLWRQCHHVASPEHRAEVTEELTPQIKKRPMVAFGWAFGFTGAYWVCMFAFYLSSLGSTGSLRVFFTAVAVCTIPAVAVSVGLTVWFLRAAGEAVRRSKMRGPLVSGIETRAATMCLGWLGVALFTVLFAYAAFQHGF